MSNLLKVAMIETIQSLHGRGWSQHRIARELGIDRETVAAIEACRTGGKTSQCGPSGWNRMRPRQTQPMQPIGSEVVEHAGRASECEPFRVNGVGKLEIGPEPFCWIYQDLVAEYGFLGGLLQRSPVRPAGSMRSKGCRSGVEVQRARAQVDFGGSPSSPRCAGCELR